MGYNPKGLKELDTTEQLSTHIHDQACLPSIMTSQVRLGSKPHGSEPFSHHNRIRTCLTSVTTIGTRFAFSPLNPF